MSCQNAAQSDDYLHSWLRQIKNMGKFEVILTNIKKTECVIKTYSVFLIFIKSIKNILN